VAGVEEFTSGRQVSHCFVPVHAGWLFRALAEHRLRPILRGFSSYFPAWENLAMVFRV
jgi:hypothetical protein